MTTRQVLLLIACILGCETITFGIRLAAHLGC